MTLNETAFGNTAPDSSSSSAPGHFVPGPAAVCPGVVIHRRHEPAEHRFTNSVSYIWVDPDHPEELCSPHPLWSAKRPAPVRFRRSDYLDGGHEPIRPQVQAIAADALGRLPTGPVRLLTQPRTWGWLFNPISIYFLWDNPSHGHPGPVAAVLEVTNTPWKQRHHYAVALGRTVGADAGAADGRATSRWRATFDKVLHVSPFLDEDHRYDLCLTHVSRSGQPDRLVVGLDVIPGRIQEPPGTESSPVLTTSLAVERQPADRATLGRALRHHRLPTHRVSAGIHRQALALWRKRVPFVAHPRRRDDSVGGRR